MSRKQVRSLDERRVRPKLTPFGGPLLELEVASEGFRVEGLVDVLKTYQCIICRSCCRGMVMRQVCKGHCQFLAYFCKEHITTEFSGAVCVICHGHAEAVEDISVTNFLKCSLLVPCKLCGDSETMAQMEDHLQSDCPQNYVQCPRPGCTLRYVLKDKPAHAAQCESTPCKWWLVVDGHQHGCDWVGNKRSSHACTVGSQEAYQKITEAVSMLKGERQKLAMARKRIEQLNQVVVSVGLALHGDEGPPQIAPDSAEVDLRGWELDLGPE